MAGIKYETIEIVGVLSEGSKGWKKELNLIVWNDKDNRYEIREWNPTHEKIGRGIPFTKYKLMNLNKMLNEMNL